MNLAMLAILVHVKQASKMVACMDVSYSLMIWLLMRETPFQSSRLPSRQLLIDMLRIVLKQESQRISHIVAISMFVLIPIFIKLRLNARNVMVFH